MRFDWNVLKTQSNRQKHGVSFEEATEAMADPLRVDVFDFDHSDEEDRWIGTGTSGKLRLLAVCRTYRDDYGDAITRIISARRATREEARRYAEANG